MLLAASVLALVGAVLASSRGHQAGPRPNRSFTLTPGLTLASPPGPLSTVLVLVFDGFAPDMLAKMETPALDRLRREGTFTRRFVPAFPSISLINGFTLSTGCWPEHHGIVTNRFYDPKRGFYDHSFDADWMTGCEGLHQAAERQGVRTAALGWYGATSSTRGNLASVTDPPGAWKDYPQDEARAEDVIRLLRLPDAQRPRLILAYFRGPDHVAHFRGLGSADVREAVRRSDSAVGAILCAVDMLPPGLRDAVSIVVTTDHGMRPVSKIVNVERILRANSIPARVAATGTTAFVYLNDPDTRAAAEKTLASYTEFDVIRPAAQPAWSHLGTGPRVGDLILSAKPPYVIEDRGMWPIWLRWLAWVGPQFARITTMARASHGYPPDTPGMAGILYAWGPAFARGREVDHVDVIDLHPTVTYALGIQPGHPVDGHVATGLLR